MIKITESSFSVGRLIPLSFILELMETKTDIYKHIKKNYESMVEANTDLSMAINSCVRRGSPARPVFKDMVTEDKKLSPEKNLVIEINNKFYVIEKDMFVEKYSARDIISDSVIPDVKRSPSDKYFQIIDLFKEKYLDSLEKRYTK